jgi:hypothetical protein
MTPQTSRNINRALNNFASLAICIWNYRPFEPCSTGHFHFCAKSQKVRSFDFFDAPKVESFAYDQVIWVSAAATKTNAANESVHQTAQLPRPGRG